MSRILMCVLLTVLLAGTATSAAAPAGTGPAQPDPPGDGRTQPVGQFDWPLPGHPVVVRGFEAPVHRFGPGHRGVDLAAAAGTAVLAAGTGTVAFAGPVAGRGVVSIEHPGGLRTTYEPVTPTVATGEVVVKGRQIGTVQPGHPGCTSCLHWGVRQEELRPGGLRRAAGYLDPLRLLGLGRLRLLPWDGDAGR